jgi:hypothetical protein
MLLLEVPFSPFNNYMHASFALNEIYTSIFYSYWHFGKIKLKAADSFMHFYIELFAALKT